MREHEASGGEGTLAKGLSCVPADHYTTTASGDLETAVHGDPIELLEKDKCLSKYHIDPLTNQGAII